MGNVLYSYDQTVAKDENRLEHERRMSKVHGELIDEYKSKWTVLDSDDDSDSDSESDSESEYEDEHERLSVAYKRLGIKYHLLEERVSKMTQLTAVSMIGAYIFMILSMKSCENCMNHCEYYDYDL